MVGGRRCMLQHYSYMLPVLLPLPGRAVTVLWRYRSNPKKWGWNWKNHEWVSTARISTPGSYVLSCHTYEWVMSHVWMGQVTHMNESCHTYEWVMSHIWFSPSRWMHPANRMNESCHLYEWVMPHVWISHVAHMNESWQSFESVVPPIWMRHITQMNESCNTYEWVIPHE